MDPRPGDLELRNGSVPGMTWARAFAKASGVAGGSSHHLIWSVTWKLCSLGGP